MGIVIGKVILGTLVYVMILVLATRYPSAAGLTLTFPALNGLGFLYADRANVPGMAKSMLWMPVINGALCAVYIFACLVLLQPASGPLLAWVLLFVVVAMWAILARSAWVRAGIPKAGQVAYALAVTGVGIIAFVIGSWFNAETNAARPTSLEENFISAALLSPRNWMKIALFTFALSVVVYVSARCKISDAMRGILTGLPLVPFGVLFSIAVDTGIDRSAILRGLCLGVWLGPAIPVFFILVISRYLAIREPLASKRSDFAVRLGR